MDINLESPHERTWDSFSERAMHCVGSLIGIWNIKDGIVALQQRKYKEAGAQLLIGIAKISAISIGLYLIHQKVFNLSEEEQKSYLSDLGKRVHECMRNNSSHEECQGVIREANRNFARYGALERSLDLAYNCAGKNTAADQEVLRTTSQSIFPLALPQKCLPSMFTAGDCSAKLEDPKFIVNVCQTSSNPECKPLMAKFTELTKIPVFKG